MSVLSAYDPQRLVEISDKAPESTWSVLIFDQSGVLTSLGPLGYDLVLILLGLACYAAAAVIFTRRDLPAPL
jgi:ABC-2 type transport system permease protein